MVTANHTSNSENNSPATAFSGIKYANSCCSGAGIRVAGNLILVFTKVMDEMSRGVVDEDEDAEAAPTDRTYWEVRGTKKTVELADELLSIVREHDPSLALKYNKFYIGLSKNGQPYNFAIFKPKKNTINIGLKLARNDDIDKLIDDAGFDRLESGRGGLYRLSLDKDDVAQRRDVIKQLIEAAYQNSRLSGQ